jgi:uncharacterized protein
VIGVDPRPRTRRSPDGHWLVAGLRCCACGAVAAYCWPVCPRCRGPVEPADFGPDGTVWSSTVVRIPVPGRTPPYGLVYVDLDAGPRLLAHVAGPAPIGARVRLVRPTAGGDPQVEVAA